MCIQKECNLYLLWYESLNYCSDFGNQFENVTKNSWQSSAVSQLYRSRACTQWLCILLHRHLHVCVYCCSIKSSWGMRSTLICNKRQIYIDNVGCIDNGILLKILNGSRKRNSEWVNIVHIKMLNVFFHMVCLFEYFNCVLNL